LKRGGLLVSQLFIMPISIKSRREKPVTVIRYELRETSRQEGGRGGGLALIGDLKL